MVIQNVIIWIIKEGIEPLSLRSGCLSGMVVLVLKTFKGAMGQAFSFMIGHLGAVERSLYMRWQKVLASIKKKKGRKLDRSGGEGSPLYLK